MRVYVVRYMNRDDEYHIGAVDVFATEASARASVKDTIERNFGDTSKFRVVKAGSDFWWVFSSEYNGKSLDELVDTNTYEWTILLQSYEVQS